MQKFKSDYCTVFVDKSEVIVYGSGSDWMVRYANTTNSDQSWCLWFAHRADAESRAEIIAKQKYVGWRGLRNEPT